MSQISELVRPIAVGVGVVRREEADGVERVAVAVEVHAGAVGLAPLARRLFSVQQVVPPPFASTYWKLGSTVRIRPSISVKRDWPRMLPVFDGLMRT